MNKESDRDHSWDLCESEKGNLPGSDAAFERKYEEWQKRNWTSWLAEHLAFPFTVTREEDEDDAYFQKGAAQAPFRLGHEMEILALEFDDDLCGITVKAKENRRVGAVPLCDVQVKPKTDKNFWPVREYVVWLANR